MPSHSIERYLAVQSATAPTFSPDGKTLAYLSDASGVAQVWTLDLETGVTTQRTAHTDKVALVRYTGRGGDMLFGMDTGGDERQQFHLIAEDGTERALTADPGTIHAWGALAPAGDRLIYTANPGNPAHMQVYELALDTGTARQVLAGTGWREVRAVSPDGRTVLLQDCRAGMFDMRLHLLDLATGTSRALCPHQGKARYLQPAWTPDGRGFYLCTDQGREFLGIAFCDPDTETLDWLVTPDWDVELLTLSGGGARLAYVTNEHGYSRLRVRDLASGTDRAVPDHPPGIIETISWRPDGGALAFSLDGSCHNADILLWTLDDDRLTPLTRSDTAGIPRADFVEPQLVAMSSFDGREIPGFLYRPAGPQPPGGYPAVIYVHGGPESQYRPQYRADIQHLVGRNYAVLAPNVRGSTGYGNHYRSLDDVHLRMDSVKDLRQFRLWLGDLPDIDAGRIAVSGRSYGGFMVLAAVTTDPDLWAAGVEFFGIANWITFFERTGPWRRTLRAVEYGDPDRDADFLRSISPIHQVDRIAVPMFVAQGLNDPRVPPHESELIVSRLRARGMPVDYMTFPDEGHGFYKLANRIAVFSAVADFLDRHV